MKISTQNAKRLITRFDNAVRMHEMIGAQHPDCWEGIERDYALAKKALTRFCIEAVIGDA